MKKFLLLASCIVGLASFSASAAITVTPGTGGTNICANQAVGGVAASFTTLGVITISENFNGDITTGFHSLVLNAPAGWQFNTGATPTIAFTAGRNIAFANVGGMTATTLTVNIFATNTTLLDQLTITGLEVQATSSGSAAGAIRASSAPGMTGITTGGAGTVFSNLSLTPTVTPSVAVAASPAGAICAGTTVTFTATPTNGGTPTYQWQINSVDVFGETGTTFVTNTLADGDDVQVLMTPTGCVSPLTALSPSMVMTVDAIPAAVTVTGAGTFCETATINASLAGPGTIYFQGATSGGTSSAVPSTSEVITTPGTHTYYFRALNGTSCWGMEGSATVTINQAPTGLAITPAAPAVCFGDSVELIASATATDVDILVQDFNSGLGAWSINNLSGNATAVFQLRASPGYSSIVTGDGTPYVQAAPDAENTVTTHTMLESPSFSTVGYTAASVSFNQYFQTWTTDTIVAVEYSTDGATWTPFIDQVGVTTGSTSFVSTAPTTTVALPAGAIGQPTVWLRWNYRSFWGWYWAIDNIAVRGTPELTYSWTGGTGLSCTTCDTTMYTSGASSGTSFTVTSSIAGCDATAGVTLTVNPLPVAYVVTGDGAYCAGSAGVNVGLVGSDLGVNYDLYMGSMVIGGLAGTGTVLDFGPQTAGTYTVLATDGITGCQNAMVDSAVITMDTLPSPITGPTEVCEGSTITLSTASTGGTWSSSDVTVADVVSTGDVTGVMAGVVDISYTLPTTCSVTYSVTVNALPVVAPITGTTSLCVGNSTTLSDATPGGTWSSADASIASIDAAGMVMAVAAGTTTITYTVTDGVGCTAFATTGDTVNAVPSVTILPAGPYVTMCQGLPVNLVATDIPGATYEWSTAGGPISGATSHSYMATAAGTYTLNMTLGACTWAAPVKTVLPDPTAVISYNSTGDYLYTGTFSTYQWFRNGIAIAGATSGIYFSPTGGDYTVVVTDITGCADTSAVFTVTPTGINGPVAAGAVRIYPNPASSILHVEAGTRVNVAIFAPDGRLVLRENGKSDIDVSNLAAGAYIIQVFGEDNTLLQTGKFSKTE